MKKLLTILLTTFMLFTLVGCNTNKEEPTVLDEPTIQEETKEEEDTILGGFTEAEDKSLNDELIEIFNKAVDGLLGAKYEPVELVATQVVAGTNYKFLANGTKTTNPVIKGTYYIIIYKDLNGNVELKDIEVIEENEVDYTGVKFWVVVYDQFDNEISRTTAVYGSTIKDPDGNDVIVDHNKYFHTVVDYHSDDKKDSSSPSPSPSPTPTPTPTCSNIGQPLYYIYAEDGNKFLTCCYEYSQDKYSFDSSVMFSKSDCSGLQVGDWFHYDVAFGNVLGKCVGGGDAAVLPTFHTITFEKNGVETTSFPSNRKTIDNMLVTTPQVVATADGHEFLGWYKEASCENQWNFLTDKPTSDITLYANWNPPACLAAGTMITMADGSRKPVETLQEGDDIRIFDHNTGKLSHAKIMDYWQYEEPVTGLMTLHFTNDIDVNIVTAHSFYNKQENKYITINRENINDYIGQQFYNADNDSWETLLGVNYSSKPVDTFFIATEDQFDCIAEGMLTMEDGIYTLVSNIFDYDSNMKVNVVKKYIDIIKYGVFTPEDIPAIKENAIKAYKLQYIKVAIGKGIITEDIWNIMVKEMISYESDNVNEEYIPSEQKHSAK
ncbi:MAG: InlB B-repeat-containing protein [Erysipelotrichaceae bacterium]|nr:InlB B-repeat-containing protein [Erysipelotrichaceae bacterium]